MRDAQIYNSRDPAYKEPYGAVPSGTRVRFRLRPPRGQGYSRGLLTARFEQREQESVTVPLPWSGREGARDCFEGTLPVGDYVGLVWYSFRLESLDGRSLELGEYQLTVYDAAEEVPAAVVCVRVP